MRRFKKKGITMALTESEKRKNFVENGNRRLRNAVKSIRLLINIANSMYYCIWYVCTTYIKYQISQTNDCLLCIC